MTLDPNLTPAELAQLAAERPDLHDEITAHPSAYPDLVAWVASQTPEPRQRRRWLLPVIVSSFIAVIAIIAAVVLVPQIAQYPSTSPLQRDDLSRIVTNLSEGEIVWEGTRYKRNAEGTQWLSDVEPEECASLLPLGTSMFTADEYPVSEDYDIRSTSDKGWLNARLFVDEDAVGNYLDEIAETVAECTEYVWADEETSSVELLPNADGVALTFTETSSNFDASWTWVFVVRENAVILLQMDAYTEVAAAKWAERVQDA